MGKVKQSVFVFVKKDGNGCCSRITAYGSLRKLWQSENIEIGGVKKTESAVRYMIGDKKKYEDQNYLIVRKEVIRSEHK